MGSSGFYHRVRIFPGIPAAVLVQPSDGHRDGHREFPATLARDSELGHPSVGGFWRNVALCRLQLLNEPALQAHQAFVHALIEGVQLIPIDPVFSIR